MKNLLSVNLARPILKSLYWAFLVFSASVAIALTVSALPLKNNLKLFVVLSGSMEPEIKTGSIVFVKPGPKYSPDDIVTFRSSPQSKQLTTHRIIHYETKDNKLIYATKGDTNKTPDPASINSSQILGKVFLTIPRIGYLIEFVKSPKGFILFVVIPATIVIYEEIKSIAKLISSQKPIITTLPISNQPSSSYSHLTLALIALVIGTSFISFAKSYFVDKEISQQNTIAIPTPTPPPQP